jgi:hypothetical protein
VPLLNSPLQRQVNHPPPLEKGELEGDFVSSPLLNALFDKLDIWKYMLYIFVVNYLEVIKYE